MRLRLGVVVLGVVSVLGVAVLDAQQGGAAPDKATATWWAQTTMLASDAMEGRDTGSAAHERAAQYVAAQFEAAGLKAAGEGGGYLQRIPMHQVDLDVASSSVEVVLGTKVVPLTWLQEVTLVPRTGEKRRFPCIFRFEA